MSERSFILANSWREQVLFDKMFVSTLYQTNTRKAIRCLANVSNANFVLYWRGAPEIFPICPELIQCWICIYSNTFVIDRQKYLKVHFTFIIYFGFETYRLIGRQLSGRQKLVASLNLVFLYYGFVVEYDICFFLQLSVF